MIKGKTLKYVFLTLLLIVMVSFIVAILYYGPSDIVEMLGVQNTYLLLFIFAILDGVSFLTSASFFGSLILISKDIPIVPLVIVSSIGLTIGDLFYYLFGLNIKNLIQDGRVYGKVQKVKGWFDRFPDRLKFVFIYLYTAVSPFPKDILCITLGVVHYPAVRIIIPMFLGNATFIVILLYASNLLV